VISRIWYGYWLSVSLAYRREQGDFLLVPSVNFDVRGEVADFDRYNLEFGGNSSFTIRNQQAFL
jgi:hypothetical protein